MRDPARIDEVLAELKAAWLANPDWRLGQLVYNASPRGEMSYVEDTVIVERLRLMWNDETWGAGQPGWYCGNVGCPEVGPHHHPSGVDWNHGHD